MTQITTENNNQSKYVIVESSPSQYTYETLPHIALREQYRKRGQKDPKSQRIGEFAMRFCFLGIIRKSQQRDSLNVS